MLTCIYHRVIIDKCMIPYKKILNISDKTKHITPIKTKRQIGIFVANLSNYFVLTETIEISDDDDKQTTTRSVIQYCSSEKKTDSS